ncbi:hypothetical protein [Paenibacillus xylanilyticus]|uniref:Group-specific protein n=1 Tax=Paenibacillus xylanilyticus TaxID=248903 RepID=A0A7Y6C489_9BACL|nr:hypothetical protein [Paenibacillus xylanilyticus]NUU79921.1 hypothetical protein [Paenibacillus xylanilyticus]
MKTEPVYAQNTITGVQFHGTWCWYVTEREYWFLNVEMEGRFGIEVLNEDTAARFLQAIQDEQVTATELRYYLHQFREQHREGDEWLKFVPSFLVDFDKRQFCSMFPEPASFEHYMPEGWIGTYEDFLDRVPVEERYWEMDGKSLFR